MPTTGKCQICGYMASIEEHVSHQIISCVRCGNYTLTSKARKCLPSVESGERIKISGWIRENQGATISDESLTNLAKLRMPSVGEKAEKILLHLAVTFPKPGSSIYVNSNLSPELEGIGWASDIDELSFLLDNYLIREKEFLTFGMGYKISPKGWAYLESLRHGSPDSQIGFIAMWFDKSVDPASLAIEAGIRNSGHEPLRIDRKEHNNKIDDEIVAGIRRSKFLVADFTGHRGGVYFETGFATGLGLPVIWLCRQDELEKTHFDTRQYNFIVWEADKLAELSKALQNRIEATIGRGPLIEKMAA